MTGPVLLVVAGGAVSHAAIARTAELAAGAPVTVVGVGVTAAGAGTSEFPRTAALSAPARPYPAPAPETAERLPSPRPNNEPEQVRRTVALAMSVLENTGVMATGHVAVSAAPARAVARVARTCGARVVILDQPGPAYARPGASGARPGTGAAGLMTELRRRMYGSGVVVLAETGGRGGWVSA